MDRRKRDHSSGMGRLPAMAPLANSYVPYQDDGTEQYDAGLGLVRGTLYPGLDLPFLGMVNGKPLPASPMAELQALSFAVQELSLYLDTHRDDADALKLFRMYQHALGEKKKEYVKKHGTLCQTDEMHTSEYSWITDPWPWEFCGNREG